MEWNKNRIASLLAELAEENIFACRALFRIAKVEYTEKVPTLAVSLAKHPVLYINEAFLQNHAQTEADVKALLMHEFLHVVLLHTEKYSENTPLLNIALDAIINSIIHRTMGPVYSDFFKRFYKADGVESLLRPFDNGNYPGEEWFICHSRIYSGKFAANDLYELLQYLQQKNAIDTKVFLLGNHGDESTEKSPENEALLGEIINKMNGTGIWNKPGLRGENDTLEKETRRMEKRKMTRWKKDTYQVLRQCIAANNKRLSDTATPIPLPLLSNSDRKAFASFRNSPFIPFSGNEILIPKPAPAVNIYLDVSGSMQPEIDQLISLLYCFRNMIRRPLWVFSNKVEKAVFSNGKLNYASTGGTSISCVFDHIRSTGSKKNMIVTDGYVEKITTDMLKDIHRSGLWVLLSAAGNAQPFSVHHIKYRQLKIIE